LSHGKLPKNSGILAAATKFFFNPFFDSLICPARYSTIDSDAAIC
jgi:hypothetical protein